MAVPSSKEELIKVINNNFSLLNKKLGSITPQLAFGPLLGGHAKGTMTSIASLVSHLISWGELVLHWYDQEAKGETIIFSEGESKWNELGRLAQKFYRGYEDTTEYEVLLARLKENKQQLVALIERFSSDEPYGKPWHNKWIRGRMIQFNTASSYKNVLRGLNKLQKCLAE